MTKLNQNNSLLLVIDVQDKLLNAVFNKTTLERKAQIMASAAKILGIPTFVTEQYPKGLGSTTNSIKDVLAEKAQIFEKTSFSALKNEEIVEAIKKSGKEQVIVFGIETHICVSQTTTALIEAGYDVSIIKDACGSRSEDEYISGLNRMQENGAHIITAEIALFEWLESAKHPNFKEVQSLIK